MMRLLWKVTAVKKLSPAFSVTLVSLVALQQLAVPEAGGASESDWRKQINAGYQAMDAGKFDEAAADLQKALTEAERVKFDDDLVAETLSTLGRLYKRKREYGAAQEWFSKALAKRKQTLDATSEPVARNMEELAYCLWDQDKFDDLKPVAEELLIVREKQPNADPDNLERPLTMLGSINREQRHYTKSVEYFNRILELRKKNYGEFSDKVADAYDDLARVEKERHNYDAARDHYANALRIRRKVFGDKSLPVARNLDEIAWCYFSERQFKMALPLLQNSLAIRKELLGSSNFKVAWSMRELSRCNEHMEDFAAGLVVAEDELRLLRSLDGTNDMSLAIADALDNASNLQRRMKKYDDAIKYEIEALTLRQKALGEHHIDVAHTLQRLAGLQCDNQNFVEALALLNRQENILKLLVGTEHPDYVSCQRELKSVEARTKEHKPS